MLAALTIIGGTLLIILETVFLRLFGLLVFAPQLAVVLVVYVGLRRSFTLGAVATLVFAAVADLNWGGPRGYYALGLTAVFFASMLIRVQWKPRRVLVVAALSAPAVVVSDIVALTALELFKRGATPLDSLLTVTPLTALWTAAIALPLVWLFDRIDRFLERRRYEAVAL